MPVLVTGGWWFTLVRLWTEAFLKFANCATLKFIIASVEYYMKGVDSST